MLKIKDNVDLKELERFGFKLLYSVKTGEIIECEKSNKLYLRNHSFCFSVDITRRILKLRTSAKATIERSYSDIEECVENTLYDLIQAGLVEKV